MRLSFRSGAARWLAATAFSFALMSCASSGAHTTQTADAVPPVAAQSRAEVVPPVTAPDGPFVLPPSIPVTLTLPSLGVVSDLQELGLFADGSLEVPATAYPAGWYNGAPTPGELGPAIIAGHVDYAGEVGVFHDLNLMVPGDQVLVERADGSTAVFVVTGVDQYPKNAFPTAAVYGDIDHAGLRLITCGGGFDWAVRSHVDNIVVYAELASVLRD